MLHCWSSGLDLKEVDRVLWNKEYSRHERKGFLFQKIPDTSIITDLGLHFE